MSSDLHIDYSLSMPSGGSLPPVGSYNALGMSEG